MLEEPGRLDAHHRIDDRQLTDDSCRESQPLDAGLPEGLQIEPETSNYSIGGQRCDTR